MNLAERDACVCAIRRNSSAWHRLCEWLQQPNFLYVDRQSIVCGRQKVTRRNLGRRKLLPDQYLHGLHTRSAADDEFLTDPDALDVVPRRCAHRPDLPWTGRPGILCRQLLFRGSQRF